MLWSRLHLWGLLPLLLSVLPARAAGLKTCEDSLMDSERRAGWDFGSENPQFFYFDGGRLYMREQSVSAPAAMVRTVSPDSCFVGNFRQKNVQWVRAQLKLFGVDSVKSLQNRKVYLILWSDNGTPDDTSDDWAAFYQADVPVPTPDSGWRAVTFYVPSESQQWPKGWKTLHTGSHSPAQGDWNLLMQHVVRAGFSLGDPSETYLFQDWDVAIAVPEVFSLP